MTTTMPTVDELLLIIAAMSKPDQIALINRASHNLDSNSWREVYSVAVHRKLQFDIIGHLPQELVVAIFEHIGFAEAYRCQVVCSLWKSILADTRLLRALLNPSISDISQGPTDSNTTPGDSASALLAKAKRTKAFNCGQPHSRFKAAPTLNEPERLDNDQDRSSRVAKNSGLLSWELCGVSFAYLCRSSPFSIFYFDFRSKKKLRLAGQGREVLTGLTLTSRYLGFVTRTGICYAYDLETSEYLSCRLPSANVQCFRGKANLLVFIVGGGAEARDIVVWNCETRRVTTVPVKCSISARRLDALAMVINVEYNSLAIFGQAGESDADTAHKFYSKQCLSSGENFAYERLGSGWTKGLQTRTVPCDDQDSYLVTGTRGGSDYRQIFGTEEGTRIEIVSDGTLVRRYYEQPDVSTRSDELHLWWGLVRYRMRGDKNGRLETCIDLWGSKSAIGRLQAKGSHKSYLSTRTPERDPSIPRFWLTDSAGAELIGNDEMILLVYPDMIYGGWDQPPAVQGFSFNSDLDISDGCTMFDTDLT